MRRTRKGQGMMVGMAFAGLLITAAGLLFGSWIVMLLLGALASLTGAAGLALGYWAVVIILALLAVAFGIVKGLG